MLYSFRDKESILVENPRFFSYTLAFDAAVRGSISDYCDTVWFGKTMVWLPDGEKSFMICLPVLTEYQRVTDRRTERRTSCHSI